MKAVMISIRPEWCEKIAFGFKTIMDWRKQWLIALLLKN